MGAAPRALDGRRVIELAGPLGDYAGKLFADMGAEVLRVAADGSRTAGGETSGDNYMDLGKRRVAVDLATGDGRESFRRMAADADAVIESFAPGHLDGLGIGYAALSALKADIVLTSVTGFGQTGPHAGWKSSDIVAAATGGAMYVTGRAEDPPLVLAGEQAALMASVYAAGATMMALWHASASGRGQHVDISAQETTLSVSHICGVGKWLDDGMVPKRMGTTLFASVPSGAYRCKDGLVYLMVNRPLHWQALARWINEETGNREVLDTMFEGPSSNRIPHRELLDLFIGELTARHSVREVYEEGQRRHIAFTPVRTVSDVVGDPQLAARGYFVEVEDRKGRRRYPGAPYRFARTPWRLETRAGTREEP